MPPEKPGDEASSPEVQQVNVTDSGTILTPSQMLSRRGPLSIDLYPDQNVLLKARFMAGDPNLRINELANCISRDPICTLELLRVANAIYFAQDRPPICTVKTAVVRLGSSNLVEILEQLKSRKSHPKPMVAAEIENLRSYARKVSRISQLISLTGYRQLTDEAQTVGLMANTGQMLACWYLQEEYLALSEQYSKPILISRLLNHHNFNVHLIRAAFLRMRGLPPSLLFAIDRELTCPDPEKTPLRFIVDSALELVEAFMSGKWEKYETSPELPRKSALRLLELSEKQYDQIYEQATQYLSKPDHEVTTIINRDDLSDGATSETNPQETSDDTEVQFIGEALEQSELLEILRGQNEQTPLTQDNNQNLSSKKNPSLFKNTPKVETSGTFVFPKEVVSAKPEYILPCEEKEKQAENFTSSARGLIGDLMRLCNSASSTEEIIDELLHILVDNGPFERSALFVLGADRRTATIFQAVGFDLENPDHVKVTDPFSPLAACFTKIKSYNADGITDTVSPFGITSYAMSPVGVNHETPVILYADCGVDEPLTFESRRLFRYVLALVNETLNELPGSLPNQ